MLSVARLDYGLVVQSTSLLHEISWLSAVAGCRHCDLDRNPRGTTNMALPIGQCVMYGALNLALRSPSLDCIIWGPLDIYIYIYVYP